MSQENQTTQSPSEESLRVEYQAVLNDIKNAKTQQWLVATYVIASQAGIIKFFTDTQKLINDKGIPNNYIYFLIVGAWLITFIGMIIIYGYYKEICKYRNNKNEVKGKLKLKKGSTQGDGFELFLILSFILTFIIISGFITFFLTTQTC